MVEWLSQQNAHASYKPPGGIWSLKHEEEEEEEEDNNRWGAGLLALPPPLTLISSSSEVFCLRTKTLHHAAESKRLWMYKNGSWACLHVAPEASLEQEGKRGGCLLRSLTVARLGRNKLQKQAKQHLVALQLHRFYRNVNIYMVILSDPLS